MIDRSRPPTLGDVQSFEFPAFSRARLSNGLEVLLLQERRVPLVLLRLVLPAGAENDPTAQPGLAALTAALLDEGTATRSSAELATAAEQLGGYLATGTTWDSSQAETSLLARDAAVGLELLADIVTHPTFPEGEVERLRDRTRTHLERRAKQPTAIASDVFSRSLYSSGPYSTPTLGTGRAIEAMERSDVCGFHSRWIRPGGSTLLVVGDAEPEELEQLATESFSGWTGEAPDCVEIGEPPAYEGRRVVVFDRPDAPQSEIYVGHVGIRRGDSDFLVASVLNALLGGKFTSRINLNLRERHGYTYGASSHFARRRGPGPFIITAAVDNEAVRPAVGEVLSEMERLQQEPVPESELAETVDYLVGSFPYTCETLPGLAGRLETLAVHGLEDDYYSTLPLALRSITCEQLRACARSRLDPENALIVAVGPAAQLEPELAAIAPVQVVRTVSGAW